MNTQVYFAQAIDAVRSGGRNHVEKDLRLCQEELNAKMPYKNYCARCAHRVKELMDIESFLLNLLYRRSPHEKE